MFYFLINVNKYISLFYCLKQYLIFCCKLLNFLQHTFSLKICQRDTGLFAVTWNIIANQIEKDFERIMPMEVPFFLKTWDILSVKTYLKILFAVSGQLHKWASPVISIIILETMKTL